MALSMPDLNDANARSHDHVCFAGPCYGPLHTHGEMPEWDALLDAQMRPNEYLHDELLFGPGPPEGLQRTLASILSAGLTPKPVHRLRLYQRLRRRLLLVAGGGLAPCGRGPPNPSHPTERWSVGRFPVDHARIKADRKQRRRVIAKLKRNGDYLEATPELAATLGCATGLMFHPLERFLSVREISEIDSGAWRITRTLEYFHDAGEYE